MICKTFVLAGESKHGRYSRINSSHWTLRDRGDIATARAIQQRLLPLHRQLFCEANPIPVKWAMARMGLCGPAMRLPMTPLTPASEPVVERALQAAQLI